MFIKKFSKLFVLALIVISTFSLSDSNVDASGSWSSYGRLAYVSFDESSTPDRDIVVWDADTDWENGRKFLVRLDGILDQGECNQRDPSLSPNGKWLAFATDCDFYGYNPNFKYWIAAINLEDTSEWYPMTIGREKNSNFNSRNPTWVHVWRKIIEMFEFRSPDLVYLADQAKSKIISSLCMPILVY